MALKKDVRDLKFAYQSVKTQLEETRKKMADVTMALAKRSDAQEKKVVGELQLLEGLIREFAGNIARKSKDEPWRIRLSERQALPSRPTTYAEALTDPDAAGNHPRGRSKTTASIFICSPPSACRNARCAFTRRCRGCAPKTARSSCRRNISRSPRPPG